MSNKPSKKSVTIWDYPDKNVEASQFGSNITYRQWCERESERMNKTGASVSVSQQGEYIAICRT